MSPTQPASGTWRCCRTVQMLLPQSQLPRFSSTILWNKQKNVEMPEKVFNLIICFLHSEKQTVKNILGIGTSQVGQFVLGVFSPLSTVA